MENENTLISESDFNENPDMLVMSGREFAYIRKQCMVSQRQFGETFKDVRGRAYSVSAICRWEHRKVMNPSIVREFLSGMPKGLIQSHRNNYKLMQEKKND